jgi:hypothetical protein
MRDFIQQQPNIPLSQPGKPEKKPWNPFARFVSIVTTLLILTALLYGGALLLSRTAGFSEIVRGRLEKHLPLTFKIGSCALTPSLGLVLNNVNAEVPGNPLGAGVTAQRVLARWNWGGVFFGGDALRELHAEGVDLHYGLDASGRWQPESFGQLSRWTAARLQLDLARYTNLADRTAAATADKHGEELDLFGEQSVQIEDALIHWQVVADSEIARVEGASLTSTSVTLPNRKVTHLLFGFSRADTAQGYRATDGQMELLEYDNRQVWMSGAPSNSSPPVVRPPPVRLPQPRPANVTRTTPKPVPAEGERPAAVSAPSSSNPPQTGSPDPMPQE